jgi:trans-aconitate methyltransferase
MLTCCRVPPNCEFIVDDYEDQWLYSHPFDFIHGRELMGFVRDYGHLFKEAFEHLKPGSYLEMQTADPQLFSDNGTLHMAKYAKDWVRLVHQGSESLGRCMDQVATWENTMREAGFIDIRIKVYKVCLPLAFGSNANFDY